MKKLQKRFYSLAIFLVMVLTLAVPAHAATYDYAVEGGNLKFDPTTGTITDCDTSVYSADIPSEIYGVPVTTIGKNAFRSCSKLASVTIPNTVTLIGSSAFSSCSQLTSVIIPDSVTVLDNYIFAVCKKLETVTIPGTVKQIPDHLFSACENLRTVTLGYGVEEIGQSAFVNCKSLESITLPDSVKSIEKDAFTGCKTLNTVTIGTGIKNIDNGAFYNTSNLSSLYFRGNAPSATDKMIGSKSFADGFMIYYPEGASGWTTPTWNGYITKSYKLSDSTPTQPTTPSAPPSVPDMTKVTAVPTKSAVLVYGQAVAFDAYNIKDNNYFKLRDLAFILSGSKVQFEVTWSQDLGAILMTSGKSYTPAGGEMGTGSSTNQIGVLNTSKLYLDGQAVDFTAYTIQGNNYFKLRDIGELFNFSVEWDGVNQQIMIDTNKPYGG